ncbi:MAG: quinoprotein dehydrogenase-associated putative ABC transporter substrate-binding protein [Methylohalobius sp.]|nr:quinoprotein dehydrogenase-associated putative ABC transporter substrate-binding protein [Methylohalobius sp.]
MLVRLTHILALAWLAGIACADEEPLRVCADPMNPPLSTQQEEGFENQIAKLFAQALKKPVVYTWYPQRIGFLRNTLQAKDPETDKYKCDVVMGLPAGFELAATTKPYYRSTYVLVIAQGKGFDDIDQPEKLFALPAERKAKLKIAMFDRTPGVTWLLRHGLIDWGHTYQAMTGDPKVNTALTLEQEFAADRVNMAVVWGPLGAYLSLKHPKDYRLLPLKSEPGIRFDYAIAMGVRRDDKVLKAKLDELIEQNKETITALLKRYQVPLVDKEGNLL